MTFSSALFTLLIGPLKTLFELIYITVYKLTYNPGFSIVGLSLVMNFLLLPLYNQTDRIQAEAIAVDKRMKPYVSHIKKTFKGNEQFMMLQTCYRQNNYKPTDAIKGISPLLLEIPFFMAAYNYLSGLNLLNGAAFGPILNLGAPDGLLDIGGGVLINVLPILMTVINLLSSAIYTKGAPFKTKLQLYGMAALFLIVLYDAPAGLAFYWTLNNLFSLIKNIFIKLKNPKLSASIMGTVISICGLVYLLFVHPMAEMRKQVFLIVALVLLNLPLVLCLLSGKKQEKKVSPLTKKDHITFLCGCLFLTILMGLLIPSAVLNASPEEFIDMHYLANPTASILSTFLMAAGAFCVWIGLFYALSNNTGKRFMSLCVWFIAIVGVVNYMFFGTDYGIISAQLKYENMPKFPLQDSLINLAVIAALILVLYIIWKKKPDMTRFVYIAAGIALAGMSVINITHTYTTASAKLEKLREYDKQEISLHLNQNGKNVIVLMMDRGLNPYIPYIMQEKPELIEKFDGFTYYPNTISYGPATNTGSPGLYGGYEYIPEQMNRKDDRLLADKHNEAMKVMPVMFHDQGFDVTVCDPSYAGYSNVPDLSIYDEYPEIRAFNTYGKFTGKEDGSKNAGTVRFNQNLFRFGLFKTAPLLIQPFLYAEGTYNDVDVLFAQSGDEEQIQSEFSGQVREGVSKATGLDDYFMSCYTVLENLTNITRVSDSSQNTFLMMSNETTHAPMLLQEPEYEPKMKVDNVKYDADHPERFTCNGQTLRMWSDQHYMYYQVNVATLIQLGEWFDYLRANNVYDNTRILIVADHGKALSHIEEMLFGERWKEDIDTYWTDDIWAYTPMFLVKDFNAHGFTTDETFMTNADVPTIATHDVIADPVNPFTGLPINSDPKKERYQHVFASFDWDVATNCGYRFNPGDWLKVDTSDIWNRESWQFMEDPSLN